MTWTKLSDDYNDDTWTLSDAAFRLHTEGLVWSNRKLLDCVIPKDDLRRFARNTQQVQELVDAGFWLDLGQSYVIRHHAQYQRTREAVIAQQERNRANGGKGGRPRGTPGKPKTQSLTNSQSDGMSVGSHTPPLQSAPETLEDSGQKTETVSEWPSDLKTKGDGPGIEEENPPRNSAWRPQMDKAWLDNAPAPVGPNTKALPGPNEAGLPPVGSGRCSVSECTGLVTDYLRRTYGQVCAGHATAVVT